MNSHELPPSPEPYISPAWPQVTSEYAHKLVFMKQGTHHIAQYALRRTSPEASLVAYQRRLLESFTNFTEGINIDRVKTYISNRGLRIAPFRLLNEFDTQRAEKMGELKGLDGSYKASYDVALVPRIPRLETVNGPELSESILVHELFHGTNEYHDIIYREDAVKGERDILHSRSGHRVHDSHGEPRGRLIEEASAERERGKYVEEILQRPFGFTKGVLRSRFYYEGAAVVDARYTVQRPNGKPYVMTESFAAQTLDLLCRVDPYLERDLILSRKSAAGLRNVAKRLNHIQPGLYVYMRDIPFGREHFRQCLIHIQQLVGFLPKQKTGFDAGFLYDG